MRYVRDPGEANANAFLRPTFSPSLRPYSIGYLSSDLKVVASSALGLDCDLCKNCQAGQYIKTRCTAKANTNCEACSSCADGKYIARACDADGLDTYCKTCSSCVAGEFVASACSGTADTVCSKSTTCAVGKFQAAAASGASDTACTTCKTCGTGKYQAAACQLTSDTSCTDCTVQPNGKFVRQACSGFSDAVYENCKTSCPGTHFIKSVCTLTDDLACEACSVCNDDQYQVSPCDTAVNAVCAACTVCPLNSRQTKACSDTADTVCSFEPAGSLTSSIVTLSSVDLNSIKKLRSLATEKANTRLSIVTAAAEDFDENDLGSVAASSSEGTCGAACTYTADTTDPKVTDFALNLNVAQPYLMITFSETVLLADFDPTKITLQSAAKRISNTEFVTLKAGSKEQGSNTDPTILKLVLDSDDVDAISSKRLLALNEASTCMVAKKEMVKDAAKLQRELTPITDQAAKPAKTLTPDDIDPALKEWTLNMKTGKLVVSFTEVMDAASIKPNEFTIQNGATASGLTRKLDTSESFSTDAASFEISLNDDDLNFIEKATTLATLVDKSERFKFVWTTK